MNYGLNVSEWGAIKLNLEIGNKTDIEEFIAV